MAESTVDMKVAWWVGLRDVWMVEWMADKMGYS